MGYDVGFDLWVAWSALSSKHDFSKMRKKYDSFGRWKGARVTMATKKVTKVEKTEEELLAEVDAKIAQSEVVVFLRLKEWLEMPYLMPKLY